MKRPIFLLLQTHLCRLFKEEGTSNLTYKLRTLCPRLFFHEEEQDGKKPCGAGEEGQAEKLSELTNEQLLVLQVIQKVGNNGAGQRRRFTYTR